MTDRQETREPSERHTITVRLEPSSSARLPVGSRWEVVASSPESLWEGPHTVTLRQIDDPPT